MSYFRNDFEVPVPSRGPKILHPEFRVDKLLCAIVPEAVHPGATVGKGLYSGQVFLPVKYPWREEAQTKGH
ncbi:MAG: hypothetical protein IPH69_06450 [Bacteroidales bacterium]|nr:hypothetical protein [Bacteroidales bacterium]